MNARERKRSEGEPERGRPEEGGRAEERRTTERDAASGEAAPREAASGEAADEPAEDGRDGRAAREDSEVISEELRRELEELEEVRDRHLRLAAEFENYRRRTRGELAKTRELAQAELTARLLDALDDLARVSSIPADSTTVEALHEGVELVERKLMKELQDAGLEEIEAEDQPFDPTLHEALVTRPTDDPEEDELVSRVFVIGYRFGDRLLRPARVEVRKYDAGSASGSDDGGGERPGRGG